MSWPYWVAIGVVVAAVLLLALVALGTARRLPPLKQAADTAKAQDTSRLEASLDALREQMTDLQQRSQLTQQRLALVKERVAEIKPGT